MRQHEETGAVNLTLYPMAGKTTEQFDNLLQTLRWLKTLKPTPAETREWLQKTFEISRYYADNIYSLVLRGGGLVSVCNGRCYLTLDGQSVLDSASPAVLFGLFEGRFVGIRTYALRL